MKICIQSVSSKAGKMEFCFDNVVSSQLIISGKSFGKHHVNDMKKGTLWRTILVLILIIICIQYPYEVLLAKSTLLRSINVVSLS